MSRRITRSTKQTPSEEKVNISQLIVVEPKKKYEKTVGDSLNIQCAKSNKLPLKDNHTKKDRSHQKFESKNDTSSSESDIEDYLQPVDKIDLNSSFFNTEVATEDVSSSKKHFSSITVTRLSDSDSSSEEETQPIKSSTTPMLNVESANIEINRISRDKESQLLLEGEEVARLNFQKLQEYTRKIEEAKKSIEQYNAKNTDIYVEDTVKPANINIDNLLTVGESRQNEKPLKSNSSLSSGLNSSSYETYSDSEGEGWEEINSQQENQEKSLLPQKELEITVEMPTAIRKKRGDDLLLAVKRRLNRKRKENQVLIHKAHLLCWIAHGNYVNSVVSDQDMMALGLSLIPSEKCYPSGRIDLDYLEQILRWYKKTINLSERVPSKHKSLKVLLTEQIDRKEAYTKKMLVLIFIIILRSLGIQCRLVLSFQVEPLRPSSSDLHFLGNGNATSSQNKAKITNTVDSKSTVTSNIKNVNLLDTSDSKKVESVKADCSKKIDRSNKTKEKNPKQNLKNCDSKPKSSKKHKSYKIKSSKTTPVKNEPPKIKHEKKTIKDENKISHKEKFKESKGSKGSMDKVKGSANGSERSTNRNIKTEAIKTTPEGSEEKNNRSSRTKSKLLPSGSASPNVRSKSANVLYVKLEKIDTNSKKSRSKSTNSTSKEPKILEKDRLIQLDGSGDICEELKGFTGETESTNVSNVASFESFYSQMYNKISESIKIRRMKIPQLDGASDEPSTSKPNLKKLKVEDKDNGRSSKHKRISKKPNYVDRTTSDSDDCFEESPPKKLKTSASHRQNSEEKSVTKKKLSIDLKKLKNNRTGTSLNLCSPTKKQIDVTSDIIHLIKGRVSEQKHLDRIRMVKKRKSENCNDSDSDYVPEAVMTKYHGDSDNEFLPKAKVKQRIQVKKIEKIRKLKKPKDANSRKVISSDSEYTEEEVEKDNSKAKTVKKGNDTWLEVFLETEEKWISVDVIFGQVHCVNELYSRASHPVTYVIGWYNNNYLKDITRRYNQNYNTATRKLRVDAQWWDATLKPFMGPKNAMEKEEDDELNRQQLEKPLPTTISEYKNHPLYALERHLLKFEALYPPNAPPLGFVRNEPVYSRDCVHICHSRDIWLKQAKVVKLGEKPYKIVKARPKYDKLSNKVITDQLLEIFGPWQVEDYTPPTAENGIVPRNAFGNVDLFKPSMLPKKCVHLQLPGLNKVARRMNIDCASAIVGFDFHGGWSHPVYDGFVVCEEFEDQLIAAWSIEQEDMEKKEQEKYEKRVYGNWKKLIKGLLIRQRLKAKYGFGEPDKSSTSKKKSKGPTFCTKRRRVISDTSSSDEEDKK